jgi:uncharacterized oxidoreductase
MELKGNTVLVTGGSNGIGFAIAQRFLQNGSTVIICGRRAEKLESAKKQFPELHTIICDVAEEKQRITLFERVTKEFQKINILVNNAGIQNRFNFTDFDEDWSFYKQEIAINLEAPIHLSKLFIHHLMKQEKPTIINISSGLAFLPPVWVPIYGATKAGVHSFTFSMREQLADTGIAVIEIIPPVINTDLAGVGHLNFATPVDTFADAVFEGLAKGTPEIGFGESLNTTLQSRNENEQNARQLWHSMKQDR